MNWKAVGVIAALVLFNWLFNWWLEKDGIGTDYDDRRNK